MHFFIYSVVCTTDLFAIRKAVGSLLGREVPIIPCFFGYYRTTLVSMNIYLLEGVIIPWLIDSSFMTLVSMTIHFEEAASIPRFIDSFYLTCNQKWSVVMNRT